MSKRMAAAIVAVGVMGGPAGALAADLDLVTKAPPILAGAAPARCIGVSEFFLTNCVLSRYGITVYGTVDLGVGYQTHGAPLSSYYPQGSSYGIQKMNRQALWTVAPGGLGASNIGIKGAESIGGDFKFIFQVEAGIDPWSLQLANGSQSLFENKGVPLNQQSANADSSRGGQFYNSLGFFGVSSPTYGTLTVFRQNSLSLDSFAAYDPLALSYAFSQVGFSSTPSGAGATETARASTAVKYRYQLGDFHAAVFYQFGGYELDNGSDGMVQVQLGGDIRNVGPGVLSVDGIFSYAKDAASFTLGGGGGNVIGAAPAPFTGQTITATISDNTAWIGLAKYAVNRFTLYAGYEYINYAPPSDVPLSLPAANGSWAGVGYPLTAVSGTAYSGLAGSGSDKHLQVMWIGGKYAVTGNVDVAVAYYHYDQNNYFVATKTANCTGVYGAEGHSQCAGTQDNVSAVVDWRLAPKWDAYFGIMYSNVNGGLANGYLARNNLDPTVGLRFRF